MSTSPNFLQSWRTALTTVARLLCLCLFSNGSAFGQDKTFSIGAEGPIFHMAISPSSAVVAIGAFDFKSSSYYVVLFDISKEKTVGVFRYDRRDRSGFAGLVFSRDGKSLIAYGGQQTRPLSYWDIQSGTITKALEVPDHGIAMTERWLVTRDFAERKSVKVLDLETGNQFAVLKDFPSSVVKAAISPDGKHLATAEYHGPMKLWELPSGKLLHTLFPNIQGSGTVPRMTFFKSEPRLAVTRSGLTIYDLNTGKALSGPGYFPCAAVSANGKMMVGWGPITYLEAKGPVKRVPYALHIWSVEKKTIIKSLPIDPTWPVRQMQFAPDNRSVVAAGDGGSVRVWDVSKLVP